MRTHLLRRTGKYLTAAAVAAASLVALPTAAHADNEFSISTTLLQFGSVDVGQTSQIIVTLTRIAPGSGAVNAYGGAPFDSSNFGAAQNCQGVTLAQGESCQFYFTFTPQSGDFLQSYTTLQIEALDTGGFTSWTINFEGNGIGEPTAPTTTAGETSPGDTKPDDTVFAPGACRDASQPVETDKDGNPRSTLPLCEDDEPLPCTTNPPPPATDEKGNPVDTKLPPCPVDLESATGTVTGLLPRTGGDSTEVVVMAALLVLLGGAVVAGTRRAATR